MWTRRVFTALKFRCALLILVPLLIAASGSAQPRPNDQSQDSKKQSGKAPNGISVGRPKVFDDRTLTLMLEGLNETLRGLQVIDQAKLATALGMQQGFSSNEFLSNLTATALPLPADKVVGTTNTGIVNDKGEPLPDTTTTTTTVDRAAFTPTIPGLDTTASTTPTGFAPTYGENASDLLSDQVSLTYQIFNLRLLLERSLSDRLLSDDKARLQAVLGFNVALDPPRTAADAVAVVEITLKSDGTSPDGLALVSLIPQEKTYNSAALSTKSNAFGGAAVVKMIQVGYSQRRRSQTFYLYRDADTISYERMAADGKSIVFGWMFRPVLGRRSVSPGLRQLFAVVSLPGNNQEARQLKASVTTYWKRYDRDTMTSFLDGEATRPAKFGYAVSLGLGKPQIFKPRYTNKATYANIEVKATPKYEQDLRAVVTGVSWRPIGSTTALVSVRGHNFFTGTKVAVGDKIYGNTPDSLALKSSATFEFTTSLEALATSPATVIGRYGAAVPMVAKPPEGVPAAGVSIREVRTSPAPLAGNRLLELYLVGDKGKALSMADIPKEFDDNKQSVGLMSPIVMVNGGVLKPPYTFFMDFRETPPQLVLQAMLPESQIENGGGVARVSWPFFPPDAWSPAKRFGEPCQLLQAVRLGTKSVYLRRHDPAGFTKKPDDLTTPTPPYCWQIVASEKATPIYSTVCPEGTRGPTTQESSPASARDLSVTLASDIPDRFLLLAPNGAACIVAMSDLEPKTPDKPKPPEVKQFDSVWLPVAVGDSSAVLAVEADGSALRFRVPLDTKGQAAAAQIEVEVTRVVTAQPGNVDIAVLGASGKRLKVVRLTVVPCLECKK